MHKYRKLPIEIEAFQMTKYRRDYIRDWPDWLHDAWQKDMLDEGSLYDTGFSKQLCIHTLEGQQHVSWDDYIIRGVQGEIYPCKPDIFEATYEKVDG